MPSNDNANSIAKNDRVEIFSTMLGALILGTSFAKEFFVNGRFEPRIFLLGISCFVLFFSVAWIGQVKPLIFNRQKKFASVCSLVLIFVGSAAAIDLFTYQFLGQRSANDVRLEMIVFLASYAVAMNLLYSINRTRLVVSISPKTIAKYLLAPINGLSIGVLLTGLVIWLLGL